MEPIEVFTQYTSNICTVSTSASCVNWTMIWSQEIDIFSFNTHQLTKGTVQTKVILVNGSVHTATSKAFLRPI